MPDRPDTTGDIARAVVAAACAAPVAYESEPQLLLLTTRHDGRADWLRAGQALQHALLLLTLRGLRASLFHQAMEWPDLRPAQRPCSRTAARPRCCCASATGRPASPHRDACRSRRSPGGAPGPSVSDEAAV
ncbi:hypothetical protein ACFQ0M_49835 [Kitasatospora aburaviensis]